MTKRAFTDENVLVDSYQRLVLAETNLLAGGNLKIGEFNSLANPDYCLSRREIEKVLSDVSDEWEKIFGFLQDNGLLIKLGDGCYRTLHMDLLVRASDTRTHPAARQAVILSKFAIMEQPTSTRKEKNILPSKVCGLCGELRDAIAGYMGDEIGTKIVVKTLEDYFAERGSGGFDPYQARAIVEALKGLNKGKKSFVITAPTGAGKTEIFLTLVFLTILKNKVTGREGKAILTYPRKMLEIDQMERIIMMANAMNKNLRKSGAKDIIIAIRDGDTQELEKKVRGSGKEEEFRGIKCGDGKLYARLKDGRIEVFCKRSDLEEIYDFIIAEKNRVAKADIVVTNFQTLAYRLTNEGGSDLGVTDLAKTDILVIDEAHEYDTIELQSIKYTLGMLSMLSEIARTEPPAIVISSATLPNHVAFARELIGKEPVDISFEKLAKKSGLTGRRLILYLVVMMSPFISWQSYISELAAIYTYLHWRYKTEERSFIPQAIVFINNVKEVNRAKSILDNALSLGSPIDNLCTGLRRKFRGCAEPPNKVPRVYRPYYDLASKRSRNEISKAYNQSGNLYPILSGLYDVVFSRVPLEKRTTIYEKIKRKDLALVYATTSLELGVDYPGVGIIINAGFDKAARLVQRIGRGGRSPDSMMTVLGIIVARNNPADYRKLNDSNFLKSLLMPGTISGGKEATATTARLRLLQANAVLRAALMKAIYDGVPIPKLRIRNDEARLAKIKKFLDVLASVLRDNEIRSMLIRHLGVGPDVIDEVISDIGSFNAELYIRWYRLASFLDYAKDNFIENVNDTQKKLSRLADLLEKIQSTIKQIKEKEDDNEQLIKKIDEILSNITKLGVVVADLRSKLHEVRFDLLDDLDKCIRPETACRNSRDVVRRVTDIIGDIYQYQRFTVDGGKHAYFEAIAMYDLKLRRSFREILEIARSLRSASNEVTTLEELYNEYRALAEEIRKKESYLESSLNEIRKGAQEFIRGE